MKFIKLNLYRTLLMCVGFMISAFGSALYVYSGLGADAFNLMVQGVSGVLGHMPACWYACCASCLHRSSSAPAL